MLTLRKSRLVLSRLALIGCLTALTASCGKDAPAGADDAEPGGGDADDNDDGTGVTDDPDDQADQGGDAVKPPKGDAGGSKIDAGGGKIDAGGSKADAGGGKTDASVDPPQRDGGTDSAPEKDSGAGPTPPTGCTDNLLDVPEDPAARGPWPAGVRTAKVGRLTVEVFYPAAPGSDNVAEVTYDARQWLPAAERKKITDDHAHIVKPVGGGLYRDVPIDEEHGPYPVIVFIHGTASHRGASVTTNTHWASRGFIVLVADYPGLGLGDQMASTLECLQPTTGAQDIPGDVNAQLSALKSPSGELAFLSDRVDNTRLAISGHSQGGCMTATLSALPNVKIVIPFSGSTVVSPSTTLESILYVSGMADTVIGYNFPLIGNTVCPLGSSDSTSAYTASPGPPKVKKRLVGLTGGGHLSVTDLCEKNAAGKSSVQELQAAGVCGVGSAVIIGLPALFDCGTVDYKKSLEALNYATTAALEETLYCRDRSKQFANIKTAMPQIGEYLEAVK